MRYVPTTDGYKELLQYLNKLYTKGLIDKEIFTLKTEEFSAKASKNTFGVINGVDPGTTENLSGFVGMPVLKGPHGDRLNTAVGSPLGNIGMFVITNQNKSPEATVRWIDHFYSDEGSKCSLWASKVKLIPKIQQRVNWIMLMKSKESGWVNARPSSK